MATATVPLYHSVRKEDFTGGVIVYDHAVAGAFYPSAGAKVIQVKQHGTLVHRTRTADVTPYLHGGEPITDLGAGTSLFDKDKLFGTRYWWCLTIPKGTEIPASLRIRRTGRHHLRRATDLLRRAACARGTWSRTACPSQNRGCPPTPRLY